MASTSKASSPPESPVPSPSSTAAASKVVGSSQTSFHIKGVEDEPCTERCRSKRHGQRIWDIALGGGDDIEVVALWGKTCLNYSQVRDEFGRTALHAAATAGKLKAVEWLIKTQPCNINAKDYISGYTPLHRSIYFGQIHVTRCLLQHGADQNVRDNEGLTPLELCQMDRPIPFKQNPGDMTELSVWGSNANYNLGTGTEHPRHYPDVLEKFRKSDISLNSVAMNTYHTAFLTQEGKLYSCGFGKGGRLGTGEDTAALQPTPVHLKSAGQCKLVAVGQDHTVILTETKVWTVGSNEFGQLGQPMTCENLLVPRSLDVLQKYSIDGVLASNVHSVFYNKSTILMCGANYGQFGKTIGETVNVYGPTVVSDRLPLDSVGNGEITTVGGSELCTAVCVDQRYIFLLRRFQHVRIDSRNTTSQKILKMQVCGEKNSITLFMLTGSGRVLVWRETMNSNGKATNEARGAFTRLVFTSCRLLDVKDFSVSQPSVLLITSTGEAYKAGWNCNNPPVIVGLMDERFGQVAAADFQIAVRRGHRNLEAPPMALELMKVKRVQNIQTGLTVASDPKGNNFAVLQRHAMMDLTDIPEIGASTMLQDMTELYVAAAEDDGVYDVLFEVGFDRYPAHRFIISTVSPVMKRVFSDNSDSNPGASAQTIKVKNSLFGVDTSKCASLEDSKIFKAVLDLIYTNDCFLLSEDFITQLREAEMIDGKKHGEQFETKSKEIVKMRNLFKHLGIDEGFKVMQDLLNKLDMLIHQPASVVCLKSKRSLDFCREDGEEYYDVALISQDGVTLHAHRCILAARLEYFQSMFSAHWNQGFQNLSMNKPLSLPFSSKALSILLDYVYTDSSQVVDGAEFELVSETVALADYMMMDRLHHISESELSKSITVKNVSQILAFAWKHNSPQLRNCCFNFISLNMTAVLENNALENLSTEIVQALGDYYRGSQSENLGISREHHAKRSLAEREEYEEAVRLTSPEILEQLEDIENTDAALLLKKNTPKNTRSRVRLRSRTLSESDSIHEQDQDATASPQDLILRRESSVEEAKSSTLATPTTATDRKYIVPLPMNSSWTNARKVASCSLKIDEFPSLKDAASSPPQRSFVSLTSSSTTKTLVKASTSNPVNKWVTPATSSQTVLQLAKPKPTASDFAPTSSKMLQQSKPKPTTSIIAPPTPPQQPAKPSGSQPPAASSTGGKKKTKWRTVKSDTDILQKPVTSPVPSLSATALTSDGRDRQNPWKVSVKKEVTFKDIVDDEVEKKRNFEKAISKPLPMMQIEDEAINFLTSHYTSEDTIDYIEILSVERVGESNFSTPMWVQHPGALTSPKPSDMFV